jgi:hypothetical protein
VVKENNMKQRTENRIWRGLFFAAIVGVGIAAGTAERKPKFVAGFEKVPFTLLDEDGTFWNLYPARSEELNPHS